MIWPTDGLQLAVTKLRTRKIRLGITIVITSLLFAVLAFLAAFSEGVIRSLKDFGREGYGSRYLVQASPISHGGNGGFDQELIDYLKPIYNEQVAQKKAAAKKLNITYDEANDPSLPLAKLGPGGPAEFYPNYSSPAAVEYLDKKNAAIPSIDYASFQRLASAAGATHTYRGTQSNYAGSMAGSGATTIIQNGKEQFEQLENNRSIGPQGPTGMETLITSGWSSMDRELMVPFVLPGQDLQTGSDGSVPTVAPSSVAEEILGLKPLAATASPQEKIDRMVELRSKIAGKTAQLCYRNSASNSLVSQAIQQQKDIEANKNNKDYVKPSLVYQLPTEPCGPVTVKSDTRTAEEKKQADNQRAFEKQFGAYVEPEQGIAAIRIVGLNPDMTYDASISAVSILSSLFYSSMGGKWLSPNDAVTANKIVTTIQGSNIDTARPAGTAYYAEFGSLQSMQSFIEGQACDVADVINTPSGAMPMGDPAEYTKACIKIGKVFTVFPFGNSAGAIEEFRQIIWKAARVILAVILVIASLIMMGNVGKIIADSRRETAVFRALGAKRLDITQIYLTYTLLLCVLIGAAAIAIGTAASYLLHLRYVDQVSVNAVLTYGTQDVHKQFALYGFNPLYVACILGLVFAAGLISASIPLIANNRRNPIRDMRDDT